MSSTSTAITSLTNEPLVINLHNDLILSNQDWDATTHKYFCLLVHEVKEEDDPRKEIELPISLYNQLSGSKSHNNYSEASRIADNLLGCVFHIRLKGGKEFLKLAPFTSARYKEKSGSIWVRIDQELRPFIVALKQCFTPFELQTIHSIKSRYSIKIYQILKSQEYRGFHKTKLENLRKQLGLNKKYKMYGAFKKHVLIPAQTELFDKGIFSFTFSEIKNGRAVEELIFSDLKSLNQTKEPKKIPITNQEDELSEDDKIIINKLNEWGSKKKNLALQLIKTYGSGNVWGHIIRIENNYSSVENKIGYLRKCLKTGNPDYALTPSQIEADKKASAAFEAQIERERKWPIILKNLENEFDKIRDDEINKLIKNISDEDQAIFEVHYKKEYDGKKFAVPKNIFLASWISKKHLPDKDEAFINWTKQKGFIVEKILLNNQYERWRITGEQLNFLNEIPA